MSNEDQPYFSVEIIKLNKKYHDIYVYDTESNLSFRPYSKLKRRHLDAKVEDVLQHFKNEQWSREQLKLNGNEPEWETYLDEFASRIW